MKAIIFAGGAGTRLWPLSRKRSPKQFEKVFGDKSTFQLSVERLLPDFGWKDIYIATSERYIDIVMNQLPDISRSNIILEPEMKDVGPAVGLVIATLYKKHPNSPIVILWSDHIIKKQGRFKTIISNCGMAVQKDNNKIIFISQKPRFASQNLGWMRYGEVIKHIGDIKLRSFESFYYRPDIEKATKFFKTGNYAWNLGYFVTTPVFLWKLFEKYQHEIFQGIKEIYNTVDTPGYKSKVKKVYSKLPKISFDNAILEKIKKTDALVVVEDLGWSDVGAWEALKEALQATPSQNVIKGKVLVTDCKDTLVYNYTNQLVVTIDLDGFLVVDTNDVVLVCHKNSVPKIKKLVKKLSESGDNHLV